MNGQYQRYKGLFGEKERNDFSFYYFVLFGMREGRERRKMRKVKYLNYKVRSFPKLVSACAINLGSTTP